MSPLTRITSFFLAYAFLSTPTWAQSEQDFIDAFAGDWYIFDQSKRSGNDACGITLSGKKENDILSAAAEGCIDPINSVTSWSIMDGQIILSSEGAEVAVVGGNQFRVTGTFKEMDEGLVIERAQGDGNSARIGTALRKYSCFFSGFTQKCAGTDDLKVPQMDAASGVAIIETLANITARAQPRRDAPSLGMIGLGTKVEVNQCLTASDGTWCSAQVGDNLVWMAMTALRQNEWPVVTYKASAKTE